MSFRYHQTVDVPDKVQAAGEAFRYDGGLFTFPSATAYAHGIGTDSKGSLLHDFGTLKRA